MTRPRVLQVITHLDLGGAEQVAISLAEQLCTEIDFTFFAVQGVADNAVGQAMARRLSAIGVPVVSGTRLPIKRGGLIQAGWRLGALIRRLRPELVHLHTEIPETTYALASLTGLPAGTRLIRTVHSSTLWPMWRRVGRLVEPRLSGAEAVAVSANSLESLRDFQRAVGVDPTVPERSRVVYNGVRAPSTPPPIRESVHGRPARVLFAGRLEEHKGANLLPAVIEAASRQVTWPVEFTILGQGPLESELRTWVQTQTTSWSVRLIPPVAHLASELAHYDLLFMPSRIEGLGLVAIESILAGTPVVASRAPGLVEVFGPGYPLLAGVGDVPDLARVLAEAINRIDALAPVVQHYRPAIESRFSLSAMAEGYRRCYATEPDATGVVALP